MRRSLKKGRLKANLKVWGSRSEEEFLGRKPLPLGGWGGVNEEQNNGGQCEKV